MAYSQEQVNQLVKEAAQQAGGTLSYQDVMRAAGNLGIDPGMISAAGGTGLIAGMPSSGAIDQYTAPAAPAAPLYESLTSQSTPEQIAAAYGQYAGMAGGDTQAAQEAAVNYLSNLGISAPTITQAYQQYLSPVGALAQATSQPAVVQEAPPQKDLASQILESRVGDQYWGGYGYGDKSANAQAMATWLSSSGITDLGQLGVKAQQVTEPVQEIGRSIDGKIVKTRTETDEGGQITTNYLITDPATGETTYSYTPPAGYETSTPLYGRVVDDPSAGTFNIVPIDSSQVSIVDGRPVYNLGARPEFYNKETGQSLGDISYGGRGIHYVADEMLPSDFSEIVPNKVYQVGQTFAGEGGTAFNVVFDEQGNPNFFTSYTGSTSDLGTIAPILSFLSVLPTPLQIPAQLANAAIAADQGNELGAILGLIGAGSTYYAGELAGMTTPGAAEAVSGLDLASDVATLGANPAIQLQVTLNNLNTARTGVQIAAALENQDPSALITSLATTAFGRQISNQPIGDTGLTVGEVVKGTQVADLLSKGQFAQAATLAGDLVNSPDLRVAGLGASILQEAQNENPNIGKMIGYATQLGDTVKNAGATRPAPKGDLGERIYDDTIVSAGAKAYIDAKNAGASDEDAMDAARVASGSMKDSGYTEVEDISQGTQVAGPGMGDAGKFAAGTFTKTAGGLFANVVLPDGSVTSLPVQVNADGTVQALNPEAPGAENVRAMRLDPAFRPTEYLSPRPKVSPEEMSALVGDVEDVPVKSETTDATKITSKETASPVEEFFKKLNFRGLLASDIAEIAGAGEALKSVPEVAKSLSSAQGFGYINDIKKAFEESVSPEDREYFRSLAQELINQKPELESNADIQNILGSPIDLTPEIIITGKRETRQAAEEKQLYSDEGQTVFDPETGISINTKVDPETDIKTEIRFDPSTNISTVITTDPSTGQMTTEIVDSSTGQIIESQTKPITEIPPQGPVIAPPAIPPAGVTPPAVAPAPAVAPVVAPTDVAPADVAPDVVAPPVVAPSDVIKPTVATEAPAPKVAPKVSIPSAAGSSGAAAAAGVVLPSTFEIDPSLLPSRITQKTIDPLQRVMEAQAELENTAMMQQIDPRLLSVLQQRMAPEQQVNQQQQFDRDIGALSRLLSGQTEPPANENNYYSYGSEDSIDSILGGRAVNYKEGGYVAPLMAEGGMALPLLAKSGGALDHYNGRENFKDGKHVAGEGDGQSDDIPAWLADGEFVFPADVVSALGNGSTKAGTDKLYEMMHSIRDRARSKGPKDLPPPALKSPLDYLKSRKRSQ